MRDDGQIVKQFDYAPFGKVMCSSSNCLNRTKFIGKGKEKESNYGDFGVRKYDDEIGRFLAIDPLLDIQPSQTPYHYCFNNPTSFTDPTGLYPEKEKGDKVQAMVAAKPELMQKRENFLEEFLSYSRKMAKFHTEMAAMSEAWFDGLNYAQDDAHYYAACSGGGGGGGYSSGRIGVTVGANGDISINGNPVMQDAWDNLPTEVKDKIKNELIEYRQKLEEMKSEQALTESVIELYKNDEKNTYSMAIWTCENVPYSDFITNQGMEVSQQSIIEFWGDGTGSAYIHIHFHPNDITIEYEGRTYNIIDDAVSDTDLNFVRSERANPTTKLQFEYHYQLSTSRTEEGFNYILRGFDAERAYNLIWR